MALTDITLDTAQFTDLFPEFVDEDPLVLESQLTKTCLSTNEYVGVKANCGQNRQFYAIFLHMAHNLTLAKRLSGDCETTPIKTVKTKNDSVTYAVDDKVAGGTGLDATRYGVELKQLLSSCSVGLGFMTCGSCPPSTYQY